MRHQLVAGMLLIALGGCSSIESSRAPAAGRIDGLVYYLPKKMFVVEVTVASKVVTDVVLSSSPSFADLGYKYTLNFGTNWVGKNSLDVQVGENALLTTAKASVESGVSDALKALAADLAAAQMADVNEKKPVPGPACAEDGKHTFAFAEVGVHFVCGTDLRIEIRKLTPATQNDAVPPGQGREGYSDKEAGIFYRSNEPYLMTATGKLSRATIVFSPSHSETHFLPMSRALFAKSNAEFGLVDGVATSYKQDTEGEVVALLKLPADVLGAYFAAVGSLFDAFKGAKTSEASAMSEELKLKLEKAKVDACTDAIKKNDTDRISTLKCAED